MAGYIGSKASVVSSGAERKKTFTITGATTSLTGLNYTVGKVHVFQNGVRLVDGTDYTATNGTTITLTVAAQSGDNVVVISQASYQVALSGIDDQSNAVAMTIDSSENVMIGGHTSTHSPVENGGSGVSLLSNGQILAGGEYPSYFNRENSDGDIIVLRKDGSAVGSIGVNSGDQVYFAASDGMGIKVDTDKTSVEASNASGADNDNAVNLGSSGTRWKDLYLSGGVYLGGTAAANKLEDYEEGTFTPTLITGTVSTSYGFYTKIGNTVIARMEYGNFSDTTSNSNIEVNNLPFTSSSVSSSGAAGSVFIRYSNRIPNATYVGNNGTRTVMWESSSGSYTTLKHADLNSSTAFIYAQVIYEAT